MLRKSLTVITPHKVERSTRLRVQNNIGLITSMLRNMHANGFNYRHMGYVASALLGEAESSSDPIVAIRLLKFCDLLAYEGVARTLKHMVL